MKQRWIAAALMLTACGAPKDDAAPQPSDTSAGVETPADPDADSLIGWLAADGPGESAAVWRESADGVEFSLTCSLASKDLSVQAKKPTEKIADGTPASFFLGADEFKSTATVIDDARQVLLKIPVTPALLKSLSAAKTARVVIGDAFTATDEDKNNTLADLAVSCGALTNITPQ